MSEIFIDERNCLCSDQVETHPSPTPRKSRLNFISCLIRIIFATGQQILNAIIFTVDGLVTMLRGVAKKDQAINKSNKECQTYFSNQNLFDLMTHHFGLLHEEHYINKIIHKSQWNSLISEIELIRSELKQYNSQQATFNTLSILREDVDNLKQMIQMVSLKTDLVKTVTNSTIPPPPPLPPSNFTLPDSVQSQIRNTSQKRKTVFGESVIPRPVITVESLRQVKLKKTPVIPRSEENKDIEAITQKRMKWTQSSTSRKRPKTADCLRSKTNSDSRNSSPRPLTSN